MRRAGILAVPRPSDVAVAAVCAALGVGMLMLAPLLASVDAEAAGAFPPARGSAVWLLVLVLAVQCAALPWARQAPRVVLLSICAPVLLVASATPGYLLAIAMMPVIVVVFIAARTQALGGLWPTLAAAALLVGVAYVLSQTISAGAALGAALGVATIQVAGLFGIPLLLAAALRARRESRDAREGELRARAGERDALIEAAVVRERTAMARELHDIAAHHLSGIALMAAALQRNAPSDPAAVQAAAAGIRTESITVLQNLRKVVGTLRADRDPDRTVPTFATIPALVGDFARARSTPVSLDMRPQDPAGSFGTGVGPLGQLAAYRAVQEALSNAAAHAPGADCIVELDDTDPSGVSVRVHNGPARDVGRHDGGGFGLIGMRERADLVGADLRYGPASDGGWDVRLVIPRDIPEDGPGGRGHLS